MTIATFFRVLTVFRYYSDIGGKFKMTEQGKLLFAGKHANTVCRE
jgi:hypothetical protein